MTFDFNTAGAEALLLELGYDPRETYPFSTTAAATTGAIPTTTSTAMPQSNRQSPPVTWPMGFDMSGMGAVTTAQSPNAASVTASSDDSQAPSPSHHSAGLHSSAASSPHQQQLSPFQAVSQPHAASLLADWTLQQQQQQQQQQQHNPSAQELQFLHDSALVPFTFAGLQPSPLDYLPTTTAALETGLQMEPTFNTMAPVDDSAQAMHWNMGMPNWLDAAAMTFPTDGLPRLGSLGSNSPTGTYLEVQSLGSGSESGWNLVDVNYDAYQHAHNAAIFNPSQTLHLRSHSDASHSDGCNSLDIGSFEEVTFPYSPFSPESDTCADSSNPHGHRHCFGENHSHPHTTMDTVSPTAAVAPVPIKAAAATASSSRVTPASGSGIGTSSSTSPPARRLSGPRKSPISKPPKAVTRRTSTGKDSKGTGEKKVGRRRGPLLPEQRKQASEIRKLRACLRCKFLKKTCDKGEPCAGCQPSHARLWQVPCTRIDIKDIGYFMKDWKADYERHMSRGVSVYNVKGFAQKETLMWITHGYGFCLPVMVREVYVSDSSCFQVDWVESFLTDQEPIDFEIRTEGLDVGHEGISMNALSEYLDKHIDGFYETFITDHFEGTPFITEILTTAYRYYMKEKSPVIRKALKLVLAYNLTMHITMVEQQGDESIAEGQIDDEDSKYYGKVVAPVMINFQIKCALADMWRELQKDILEELSALYSSVYSGDRLKNWPTIFMLASILLVVWEEMQFDCHYRVPDPVAVNKFCSDMETTPVGVIVGLFHAISQKLPAFTEWDTRRHGQLLNNNPAVCEAMTEVKQHVLKHEAYLRTRPESKFDRYDFDSLSNKFLSKLVIRAN